MTRADPETAELDDRHGAAIRATAALPPLEQVEALVSLFAALLIGELVLTRMRLAASAVPSVRGGAPS